MAGMQPDLISGCFSSLQSFVKNHEKLGAVGKANVSLYIEQLMNVMDYQGRWMAQPLVNQNPALLTFNKDKLDEVFAEIFDLSILYQINVLDLPKLTKRCIYMFNQFDKKRPGFNALWQSLLLAIEKHPEPRALLKVACASMSSIQHLSFFVELWTFCWTLKSTWDKTSMTSNEITYRMRLILLNFVYIYSWKISILIVYFYALKSMPFSVCWNKILII